MRAKAATILLALLGSAVGDSVGVSSSVITWASHPVLPNETLLLQVSPFPNGSRVLLEQRTDSGSSGGSAPVAVLPEYATDAGVAVIVPPSFRRIGVFTAAVEGSTAPPFRVNAPDLMWVQGSEGEETAPGGWIRVFGRSLAFVPVGQIGLSAPPVGWLTTLRLTPTAEAADVGTATPTVIAAAFHNVSSFQAFFRIPKQLAPRKYTVALSNGPSGYAELDVFIHPMQPHVSTIVVRAPPSPPTVSTQATSATSVHETSRNISESFLVVSGARVGPTLGTRCKRVRWFKTYRLERPAAAGTHAGRCRWPSREPEGAAA